MQNDLIAVISSRDSVSQLLDSASNNLYEEDIIPRGGNPSEGGLS